MGKKSRIKRERREQAGFVASLTNCEGTWLEHQPSSEESERILAARKVLEKYRLEAQSIGTDIDETNRLSLMTLSDDRFTPLYFDDWVIAAILDRLGEPPIVEDESDPAFSTYLREAVLMIASSPVRRAMAEQVRRFIPAYIESGQIQEALLIEHNAYMTVMSEAVTPLLAQMLVGGLSRWYDEHDEEIDTAAPQGAS